MDLKFFRPFFSFVAVFFLILSLPFSAHAYEPAYNRTVGGMIYGSVQLVDTLPIVDAGIGGGAFFDYRFNQRFSFQVESFIILQDGDRASLAEKGIEFFALPAGTLKIYPFKNTQRFDPYFGLGLGLYMLTEGDISNNTFGLGLGAQIETGVDINLADNLLLGVGGTYRSVGLLNSLSGTANASTYMPYTLFGRIGYRF